MFWQIAIILICLFSPGLWIKVSQKLKINEWLNPIVLCYLSGILIRTFNLIPVNNESVTTVSDLSLIFALPLLLFSTEIRAWFQHARTSILSFAFCMLAVAISSLLAHLLFQNALPKTDQLAAMLVGAYTGGTPNLFAIGKGLHVDGKDTLLLNSADMLCGALYILFLTGIGKSFLSKFLPPFQPNKNETNQIDVEHLFKRLRFKTKIKSLLSSIGIACVIVAVSLGLSKLLFKEMNSIFIITMLTTLAIIASLFRPIRKHKSSYEAGQYLLLIFAVAIGLQANFMELLQNSPWFFVITATVMFGAIFIHISLSYLFKIDVDTVMITSTAAIFGPAFVGQVSAAINNKYILFSGMITGLIGYAVGNYLGFLVYWMLRAL